jgi:hypothetical protein
VAVLVISGRAVAVIVGRTVVGVKVADGSGGFVGAGGFVGSTGGCVGGAVGGGAVGDAAGSGVRVGTLIT